MDEDVTPSNLHEHSSVVLAKKERCFEEENRCRRCFMIQPFCVCQRVREIFCENPIEKDDILKNVNISLFLHFKEWGRASNTGKLLQLGLGPRHCQQYIFGQEEDEERLLQHLRSRKSVILYPNKSARPISEYRSALLEEEGLSICVIDTTWSLSSAMERSLPADIPRVAVDEFLIREPSRFLNRKQSENSQKISTIEAVTLALQALTLPEGSSALPAEVSLPLCSSLQPFMRSLEYSVDAVRRQRGLSSAFGNSVVPNVPRSVQIGASDGSSAPHYGPITVRMHERPTHCLHCSAVQDNRGIGNFQNMGIRYTEFPRVDLATPETEAFLDEASSLEVGDEAIRALKLRLAIEQNVTRESDPDISLAFFRLWKCKACKQTFPSRPGAGFVAKKVI